MSATIDTIRRRLAAGEKVKPSELAEAESALRLDQLRQEVAAEQALDRAADERRQWIADELGSRWEAVDVATDKAAQAFDTFRTAHAALVAAVDDMLAADQAARSFVGHEHVEAHEMPERHGRGLCERDALGGSSFKTPVAGGGHETLVVPVSAPYFAWIKARRAEG